MKIESKTLELIATRYKQIGNRDNSLQINHHY